jgi:hypothetical protein
MSRTDLLHHHTDDPCEECAKADRESELLRQFGLLVRYLFEGGFLVAAAYWAWKGQWFTAWAILALLSLTQIERNTRPR